MCFTKKKLSPIEKGNGFYSGIRADLKISLKGLELEKDRGGKDYKQFK